MIPSKPSQETDTYEELILTPSLSGEQPMRADLVLEAGDIFLPAIVKETLAEIEGKLLPVVTGNTNLSL